jgi:capsid protein
VKEIDADGQLDFYGLQNLVARAFFESGEVLVRRRVRRVGDGLQIPLQHQLPNPGECALCASVREHLVTDDLSLP